MSVTFQPPADTRLWIIPAAIVLLAGLFPPETRPPSMIGCSVLIAAGALALWVRRLDGARALTILLTTGCAAVFTLFADSRGALIVSWSTAVLAFAVAWIVFCLPKDVRAGAWLPVALAVSGSVATLHAVYQRLWGLEALAAAIREGASIPDAELVLVRAEVGRAFASFPTPAALGGYLVLGVTVGVATAWSRRGLQRWVWAGLSAWMLVGLACTESVTAVLALLGAVALAALAGRISRRAAIVLVLAAVLLGAGVFLARGSEVLDVGGKDTPWSLRAKNFRIAGEMIEAHPWTGVGPGAFGEHYPKYRRPGDNETRYAHNLPLQLAAELGVPLGAAASLAFFLVFVGPLFRRSAEYAPVSRGTEIGLAAFALQNLADFTVFLPSILFTAVLLRAAVARRDALAWAWPSRLPAIAAVVLTLVSAWVAIGSARAEHEHWEARLAMSVSDRPDALRRTERAASMAPWQADYWIALAQLRALTAVEGDVGDAMDAVEHAVRLAPHRAAAFDLRGRLRFLRGDFPGAYADALQATRLYPMHQPYAERLMEVERWIAKRMAR